MSKKKPCEDVKSPASKAGQLIGAAFEHAVIEHIRHYLENNHPEYALLEPEAGKRSVKLDMHGGLARQMDNVFVYRANQQPVALMETKWLKDARHHNDKGAWILQLREVRKKYATIRGAAAVLAGHWTQGVGVMLMGEGGIKMVLVATDVQVYSTLQPHLDALLGDETYQLDARQMRDSTIRPRDFLRLLCHLHESNQLIEIARTWLDFMPDEATTPMHGRDLVTEAIKDLLRPLPQTPKITKFEIALQVDTGNTIYMEFTDFEEAQAFLQAYHANPDAILRKISPQAADDDS